MAETGKGDPERRPRHDVAGRVAKDVLIKSSWLGSFKIRIAGASQQSHATSCLALFANDAMDAGGCRRE